MKSITLYNLKMVEDNGSPGKKRFSGLYQSMHDSKNSVQRVKSCSVISNCNMNINSPRGKAFRKELNVSKESNVGKPSQELPTIAEPNKESSSESEDDTSSDGSDSSVDAMIEGDESEAKIYQKILDTQERNQTGEEGKIDSKDVKNLVDKNMIDLLRACSMLQRPSQEDIEARKVRFGERTR